MVREKISTQSQLASDGAAGLPEEVKARMDQSCELLDSVGEQIDLDQATNPTRVMGLAADPPAVTFIVGLVLMSMSLLTEGLLIKKSITLS